MISVPGYQVNALLYNGSRTEVYRAIREDDRKSVVIKIIKNAYPNFQELLQFRNQYAIAKNINIPGIICPYSLESYQNGYALVMEDFGGVSLQEYIKENKQNIQANDLEEKLSITVKIADILYDLHKHCVIHKDIKPANILIHPYTKQIKLIDFSIASLLPKESQEIKNPNGLEGTLAYLSPEQTGRMNRGIDYRADFYALGVTLFELLTGELPFVCDDPMELLHCHIAKQPPKLSEIKQIPPVLDNIVQKLMAKNAEDRYQSALGLKYDLQVCLTQLEQTGKIEEFEIGTKDICDRFIIPEKLYGREKEVEQLLAAFERVSSGNSELMLVAGFSGIGKTAVVNEVHKPIVKQRGYFIKGKFDQFNRNVPLDAFVQAFRNLIGQLLSESDAQLSRWKDKILQAVGEQGQVIIDVIPELEKIIGKQPPVPELSGTAAQNRFNLLFQKFIQVFTTKEHPLVIFLDDLQWADSASLNLIELLVSKLSIGYLLIIGAYRDNEVFPAHPLKLMLSEVEQKEGKIEEIILKPLSHVKLNQLVSDTLKSSEEAGFALSELVYRKTEGNPFFATQFLKSLYQEQLITFNWHEECWQCDVTQIHQQSITTDVVEFMVFQLQRLPESTQNVLKLAACIGNQFDLETLAIISEQSPIETAACLWNALQAGLILPQSDIYKFFINSQEQEIASQTAEVVRYRFLHDRIQQAAYSLIPVEEQEKVHYHIGQLLLLKIAPETKEDRIFELVNQLNCGINLIVNQIERDELAQLNLIACRKARTATAYEAAREYAQIGLQLLGTEAWYRQYAIALAFHELATEIASLSGDFAQMETFINTVRKQAHSFLEQVNIYRIHIQANYSRNKFVEAIAIATEFLQNLGITFPESPTPAHIQEQIAEIKQLIGEREIADLVNLPIMTDPEKIAIVQIANSIVPAAYLIGSPLQPLLITLAVKLSIQYGNTSASTVSYAGYSSINSIFLQDIETAIKLGQLVLELVGKFDTKAAKSAALLLVGLSILHRHNHIQETLPLLQEAYGDAIEVGNYEDAGNNAHAFCLHAFWSGQPLTILERKIHDYWVSLTQFNQVTTANYCRIYWQPCLNLLKGINHPTFFSGNALQETEFLPQLIAANDLYGLYIFYLYKLVFSYLFGEIESAQKYALEVKRYLRAGAGLVSEPAFYLYDSLVALASLATQPQQTAEIFLQVEQNQQQLQQYWANYAPMNYQHKYDLVVAEKYRVLNKNYQAADWYDRAISGAKENGYIQEEALANELAAKFYLDWGKEKVASGYMQEAYYCYARWEAKAKTDDLEQRYPDLLRPILQQQTQGLTILETIASPNYSIHSSTTHRSSSSISINQSFDFENLMKASQIISSSIELDELIKTLTGMMLEYSGADKCALMLSEKDILQVRAVRTLDRVNLQAVPIEGNLSIPSKLIQYVKHSQDSVVIDKLQTNLPVIGDYLSQHQPQSVLCLPILNQGKLLGVLYLENKSASRVFTSDRIIFLNFLCTQAAISLENARLYEQQQEKTREIAAKEAEYRSIFESVSDGLLICDLDTGKLIACNPTYCQIYGYTETDFSSLTPADYIHSDYLDLFSEYLIALKTGKEFYTQSVVGKRKDGSYFDAEVKAVPFIYKGKLHGLTIIRDISEQKAAKKALEETNTLLNSLLQTIPDIFFAKDLQGRFIAVNANMAKSAGKSIPEIIGKNDTELFSSEFAKPIMAKDREIMTKGITETLEEVVPINGVTRTFLSVKTPLRDSQGNVTGLIGLTRDITDRKQAEAAVIQKSEELEKALQELQQAQLQMVQNEKMASLGNLVAGVAHEINNPIGFLNGSINNAKEYVQDLIGHLELYQQNYPEPAEEIQENHEDIDLEYLVDDLPKLLDAMTGANKRIKSISTSLRTFSRADTDRKVSTNLHEGLDSTLLILKYRLKANENRPAIVIQKEYGDIPEIECFPGQLNQVFMNILANAIDMFDEMAQNQTFTELEANPQQITIATELIANQVYIRIGDNGKGMSEEIQAKIFDHLFTTKAVGKGTGLGLAIAKQIVEETHNGKLTVRSQVGQGTEFSIQIPIF